VILKSRTLSPTCDTTETRNPCAIKVSLLACFTDIDIFKFTKCFSTVCAAMFVKKSYVHILFHKEFADARIGCHRFYYLAPFTVFDSFSHPFLPCQCLFTFCVVWRINLRTVSLRRSSLVECVSVLHGTCLQSVDFFFNSMCSHVCQKILSTHFIP
jgi:hypothetical protein